MIQVINPKKHLIHINNEIKRLERSRAKKNMTKTEKAKITRKINLLRQNAHKYFKDRKEEYPRWLVPK